MKLLIDTDRQIEKWTSCVQSSVGFCDWVVFFCFFGGGCLFFLEGGLFF